ncbi:MAG: hypothetical protein RMJ44_05210 [Cytophagales bacterium]|nr:hypothetical protein [Bernardetiaceae bacterium]MDW8210465.1 hypothetical protein [Cytophagales bacterium]
MRKTLIFCGIITAYCSFYCSFAQPGSGLDFYVKAVQAKKAGQLEAAIQNYDMAIQREPGNHFYLYEKALCEYILRRYPQAKNTLASVTKLRTDYVPAYVLLAKIGLSTNETKQIVEALDLAIKYEQDKAKKVNYKLITILRLIKEGEVDNAYERVKQAYQLAPEDTTVVYLYSRIANTLGKYAETEGVLQKFVPKINNQPLPFKARYYYELGFAQFQQEQYEKALASWKNADYGVYKNKIERFSPKNYAAAALTYYKIYEDSLANYYAQKALAIEKGFPAAHVILVQIAKRKVDHSAALAQLQSAVQHETNIARKKDMLMNIAEHQLQMGKYEEAMQMVNQLLSLDADNQKAQLLRLVIPYHQQKYQAVITAAEPVIKKIPEENAQAPFIFLQGMAFKKSGQKEGAIKTFRRLLSTSLAPAASIELEQLTPRNVLDEEIRLQLMDPPEAAK